MITLFILFAFFLIKSPPYAYYYQIIFYIEKMILISSEKSINFYSISKLYQFVIKNGDSVMDLLFIVSNFQKMLCSFN